MSDNGFSLIEFVMVLLLVGILAAGAAVSLTRSKGAVSTAAFAKKVRDDIRYAQTLAISRSGLDTPSAVSDPVFMYRIRFNVPDANCAGANEYAIVNDADYNGVWGENPNGAGAIESAKVPSTGAPYFCVQMDSGNFKGFSISADFGGGVPGVLQFDAQGVPYDSDRVRLTTAKNVIVSKDNATMTLVVTPNTGYVRLQ